jgi:hypothetical protein
VDRRQRKTEVNISRIRAERARAQETYTTASRGAKASIKADKMNHIEALAADAAQHGNIGAYRERGDRKADGKNTSKSF